MPSDMIHFDDRILHFMPESTSICDDKLVQHAVYALSLSSLSFAVSQGSVGMSCKFASAFQEKAQLRASDLDQYRRRLGDWNVFRTTSNATV